MSKNSIAHFRQGESAPNIELIIRELINRGIVPDYVSSRNWVMHTQEIINAIEKKQNGLDEEMIDLLVFINNFKGESTEVMSRLTLRESELQVFEEDSRAIAHEVISKIYILHSLLRKVLDENIYLERFRSLGLRDRLLVNDIRHFGEIVRIISQLRMMRVDDSVRKTIKLAERRINFKEALGDIEKLFEEAKSGKAISVKLNLKLFLAAFVARISIFKGILEKEDLIEKFENRKNKKKSLAFLYIFSSMGIFYLLLLINFCLFISHIGERVSPAVFVEYFFGQTIYLLGFELMLISIAVYLLSLFRTYTKIVELYDSHILLIESDFFYKNDEHFQNLKDEHALFGMRKENTQKIHSLPERTFDILCGVKNNTEKMNPGEFLHDLLGSLRDFLMKKK